MKRIFYFLLLMVVFTATHGQTWINTPFIEYMLPSIHQDTATVGPIQIVCTPDNHIIMTLQSDQDHATMLLKYDSAGSILWSKDIASFATLHTEYVSDLHATIDNGCIYHWIYTGSMYADSVVRRNTNGNIIWGKYFSNQLGNNHDIVI